MRWVRKCAATGLRGRVPRHTRKGLAIGGAKSRPNPAAESRRPDSWYVAQWSRLAEAVSGPEAVAQRRSLHSAMAPRAVRQAGLQRARAAFAEAVAQGDDLEASVCRCVAALADVQEWHAAWALMEGARRMPDGARASAMGRAVLLHRRRQFDRVWNVIRDLEDDGLAAHIPVEAVDAALAVRTAAARQRALAIGVPTEHMGADVLVDLAGRFLALGERDRAAELAAEFLRRPSVDLDDRRRHAFVLIQRWLDGRQTVVPAGSVPFAVMDYQSPDHVLTSGNVGDYIQTLSMVGNLARLSNVSFSGDDGLGALATELQGRVLPPLRLPDVHGAVHLIALDRDFSSAADVPVSTWMVAFGWHMHPLFDLRYDFPYHPNIRPLLISFHVSRVEMLTDEARAYLRSYGPVGCRDWNTVFLLLSAGIDAFFTGCLTTTIDALYPSREAAYRGKGAVGVIDLPRRTAGRDAQNVRVYSHQADDYRAKSLTQGLRAADATLTAYQRDLDRAVTRRLDAYLPLTALGVPVEFKTNSPGDVRFAGLMGLRPGDARLSDMRGGIRDLLAKVLDRILAGAAEAEVYSLWRELTAERVAEAKARFAAPLTTPAATIDVAATVATTRAGGRQFGPHETVDRESVTNVAVAFDQNLTLPAAVLFESIVSNASGALRFWVLGRGLTGAYEAWLAAAFPSVPMTFLSCDAISYWDAKRPRRVPSRITVSTMDRLLLPGLLPEVDRVVYLDVDTLVLDDICRLATTDLAGRPVAARDSNVSEASEWQRSARRLEEPIATNLRRWMGFLHAYGHAALNAGVLVLDLARMRRDDFTASALARVEQYGLHDQDAMLAYAGPDRTVLDPRWNSMPVIEDVYQPSLIHWASFGKPWERQLTFEQDRWRTYAAQLHRRAGAPPATSDRTTSPTGYQGPDLFPAPA